MTVDFGFIRRAQITSYVWLDFDRDGNHDGNEDYLKDITVILTPPGSIDLGAGLGNPISTVTDVNGIYTFNNLPPFLDTSLGYVVSIDANSVPANLELTFSESGLSTGASTPIQLNPAESYGGARFGYAPTGRAIGDLVWVDANGNGLFDNGELPLPMATITLDADPSLDIGAGVGVALSVVTDSNGRYLFPDLPVETVYRVTVDTNSLPNGYTLSANGDPDVRDGQSTTPDDTTLIVIDGDNPVNLDADFGYTPPASANNIVGGTIWLDVNADGVLDPNEQALFPVTLDLVEDRYAR